MEPCLPPLLVQAENATTRHGGAGYKMGTSLTLFPATLSRGATCPEKVRVLQWSPSPEPKPHLASGFGRKQGATGQHEPFLEQGMRSGGFWGGQEHGALGARAVQLLPGSKLIYGFSLLPAEKIKAKVICLPVPLCLWDNSSQHSVEPPGALQITAFRDVYSAWTKMRGGGAEQDDGRDVTRSPAPCLPNCMCPLLPLAGRTMGRWVTGW